MKKVFCLLSFLGVFSNSFSNNLDTNFENDTKNFRQENLLMEQKIKDNELKNFNPTDIKIEELKVNNEAEKKGYDSMGYKELYEYYLKDNMLKLIEERQNRLLNKIGTGDAK